MAPAPDGVVGEMGIEPNNKWCRRCVPMLSWGTIQPNFLMELPFTAMALWLSRVNEPSGSVYTRSHSTVLMQCQELGYITRSWEHLHINGINIAGVEAIDGTICHWVLHPLANSALALDLTIQLHWNIFAESVCNRFFGQLSSFQLARFVFPYQKKIGNKKLDHTHGMISNITNTTIVYLNDLSPLINWHSIDLTQIIDYRHSTYGGGVLWHRRILESMPSSGPTVFRRAPVVIWLPHQTLHRLSKPGRMRNPFLCTTPSTLAQTHSLVGAMRASSGPDI